MRQDLAHLIIGKTERCPESLDRNNLTAGGGARSILKKFQRQPVLLELCGLAAKLRISTTPEAKPSALRNFANPRLLSASIRQLDSESAPAWTALNSVKSVLAATAPIPTAQKRTANRQIWAKCFWAPFGLFGQTPYLGKAG